MLEMNLMYRLDINVNHFIRKKLYTFIKITIVKFT